MILSVVIPTYFRKEVLEKTLLSLENQITSYTFEVIVINDGPPEELPPLHFGQGKRKNWKLIQNRHNSGRAITRNKGIMEAKGTIILFIDNDIYAVPELITKHIEKQNKINGGVVIGAVPPAKECQKSLWNQYLVKRYERIEKRLKSNNLDYGLFFTGNVSVPKKTLVDIGLFNESFKEYSLEDSEMGYRLQKSGILFVHEPEAIGYHHFNETFSSLCTKAFEHGKSVRVLCTIHPEMKFKDGYVRLTNADKSHRPRKVVWGRKLISTLPFGFFCKWTILISYFLKTSIISYSLLPYLEMHLQARGYKTQ